MSKKNRHPILEGITIESYAAEGKCIARVDNKVIFVEGAVPGDVVNLYIKKSKKDWAEASVHKLIAASPYRVSPVCQHFGTCGGCKWQMLPYELQLQYKQQQVQDVLQRIGKITTAKYLPIVGSAKQYEYRNKLEFTFCNKQYLSTEALHAGEDMYKDVLGFHAPRLFDKVIDIAHCHLMPEPQNELRNALREYAIGKGYTFYDVKQNKGLLRNMMLRTTSKGDTLCNIIFGENDEAAIEDIVSFVIRNFARVTSLYYTINTKLNDTIYDLPLHHAHGHEQVLEYLENYSFAISPKSFFQTNTAQAEVLYQIVRRMAALQSGDVLYDLYCGTGSIGIFCSQHVSKIIGVESVEDAVLDARENAKRNNVANAHFFAGDVIKICTQDFFAQHGAPHVVIVDPPRAGMHTTLIEKLLYMQAPRIVYVSCNPATQARDLALLTEKYNVTEVQAVDMFPHTHHVESVAVLELR